MKIYILCGDPPFMGEVDMYARIMNFRIPLVAASEQGTAQTV